MRSTRLIPAAATLAAALSAFGLGSCAGGAGEPAKPVWISRERPQTEAQRQLLQKADGLFKAGGEPFAAVVEDCRADPVVAMWLCRAMFLHMQQAERRHRDAEVAVTRRGDASAKGLVAPSLEENPRYTRARGVIVAMGQVGQELALREWLFHKQRAVANVGIEVLAHSGVQALPRLREEMARAEPQLKERIVGCVAMMRSSKLAERGQIESQLLAWSEDTNRFVRAGALEGLARLGERHLDRICVGVREDPDDFVRRQLAKVLSRHRTRAAATALVAFYARAERERDGLSTKVAEDALRGMARVPPRVVNNRVRPYGLTAWRRWLAGAKFPD